jgi:hypothetical protein
MLEVYSTLKNNLSIIITTVSTFAAALAGSWSAYKLQVYKENKKTEQENISAINKALFVLLRQINSIEMFKRDLDKHIEKHEIERAFIFPAWKPNSYNDLKFDSEKLSFILDTKDANILHELFIVQESFEQTIETINQRSIYFINQVTPEMELKEIESKLLTVKELKNEMDINKINGLVIATNNMYEHVYGTHKQLEDIEKNFFNFAKSLYPNQKFIRFEKL